MNQTGYNKLKIQLFTFLVFAFVSLLFGGYYLYIEINEVPLQDQEFTAVNGTIESYAKHPRYYEIVVTEDSLEYSIATIYQQGFDEDLFENNVRIGDNVELICSDYMGSTIFNNSTITQATIYSVKVDDTYYLTYEESLEIYASNSGIDAGVFIILAFSLYPIGGSIYSSIKLRKLKNEKNQNKIIL